MFYLVKLIFIQHPLLQKSFAALLMYSLSHLINFMHPFWTKVWISYWYWPEIVWPETFSKQM